MRKFILAILLTVEIFATMQTATVKNLELKADKLSLDKDTSTKLELTPTLSKGKVAQKLKDAIANPEFIVRPKDAVKIDYKTKTIIALKDTNVTIQAKIANTLSNTIKLSIYWEVDGHRLPPEPNPKVNNSTLLGVDSNNNGVRDDVERWIYETYEDPIERGIFMQSARAYNIMLNTEPNKYTVNEKITDMFSCVFYLKSNNKYFSEKYKYKNMFKELKKQQFNTLKRLAIKRKYELSLSGGVYSLPKIDNNKCKFDINGNLKDN